jgi:hypothetical protein
MVGMPPVKFITTATQYGLAKEVVPRTDKFPETVRLPPTVALPVVDELAEDIEPIVSIFPVPEIVVATAVPP